MSVICERLKTASKSSENVADMKYYEQGDQNCPLGAVKSKMRVTFAWESHIILSSFYKISFHDATAPVGPRPPHYRGLLDSSGRVISPTQRPLPDDTQHK